jgi:hypothetical protein
MCMTVFEVRAATSACSSARDADAVSGADSRPNTDTSGDGHLPLMLITDM